MPEYNFSPFPVLETERLVLRNLHREDVEDVYAIRSNADTMQYIPRPLARNLDDAHGVIDMITGFTERNERINWAITEKGVDKLIGIIGYVNFKQESFRAEIGYMLNHEYWGRGIAKEASLATINYGFDTLKLHAVEAIIRPENTTSKKLVEQAGFVKEGYFRDYIFHNGDFWDMEVYTLINPNDTHVSTDSTIGVP